MAFFRYVSVLFGFVPRTSGIYLDLGRCFADVDVIGHVCCVAWSDFEAVSYSESSTVALSLELPYIYTNT